MTDAETHSPTKEHPTASNSRPDSTRTMSKSESQPGHPASDDPTEAAYKPRSASFWLVILSIYLAFFLIALDRTIIATAIPAITNSFDSISDIGWYGSAYMLTCGVTNPVFGSIYRLYSVKTVFLVSVVIFEAGSALCGAAPTSVALIIGRAIAGIGAAGISCGAVMIVVTIVPLRKRPVFTSLFGMAFGVSSVLGPVVGGTFADSKALTWRWCFYINLPLGAVTLLAIVFFFQIPQQHQQPPKAKLTILQQIKRLDLLGILFFAPSIVCLILALQWGGTNYAWSNGRIIGLLVTFAVTFCAFLVVEHKMPDTAMAPKRVVLQRSVAASMFFTFLLSGGMMSAVYYLSIWFQAAQGQSAMQAGIRTIPMVLSLVLFGICCAIVTQKIGYYVPALLVSPVLSATAAGLLSTLTPESSSAAWIGFQVLYGCGVGAGAQTANLAAQTVLKREDVPLGTAMGFFMQQVGGSVFLAVAQNVFSSQLIKDAAHIAGLDAQVILNTGATDLKKVVPAGELSSVVHAYSHALTRVFVLSAALSAATIIGALCVEWRSIKDGGGEKQKKEDGEKA